jgi:p-aminobenzoyl-glutamate transporter AbgT
MWALLTNVFLDPVKRALHPDSPVLNSGWEIKAPFFGMVAAIFAITLVAAWIVSRTVGPVVPAEQTAAEQTTDRADDV